MIDNELNEQCNELHTVHPNAQMHGNAQHARVDDNNDMPRTKRRLKYD